MIKIVLIIWCILATSSAGYYVTKHEQCNTAFKAELIMAELTKLIEVDYGKRVSSNEKKDR